MSSYPPPPPGPQDPYPGQHGGGQQYPGPQDPGQYGAGQPYPGQYGQQYPGQQSPGQQSPGQYGAGQYPGYGPGAQQYPGQYADQYPGQYGPGSPYGQYPGGGQVGADDPLVSRSISEWFSKIVGVVSRSWQPLIVIQLVAALPGLLIGALAQGLMGPDPSTYATPEAAGLAAGASLGVLVAALISIVFALFAQGASVFIAVRDAVGRPAKAGEALSFAAGRALPLFGWGLLAGLMLVIGFLLLVLPGLYLAIVFGAALTGVVVIERQGIGRTFALVNNRFWPTAGRLVLICLIAVVYNFVVTFVVTALAGPGTLVAALLAAVLTLPVSLVSVGVAVVTYAELRNHENPAVGSPALAAQMEG